jgi:hypothetical protein
MKKTLLLLTLSLACIMMHAQKIDTTLLYGRWDIYSMNSFYFDLCRDSLDRNIRSMMIFDVREADMLPGDTMKYDSIQRVKEVKVWLGNFFKSYVTFDDKGNMEFVNRQGKNLETVIIENGTYAWTGENKLTESIGDKPPFAYTIPVLTTSTLTLQTESNGVITITTFTKAQ